MRTDVKMLYQKLGKKQVKTKEAPPKDGAEEFWKWIWGEKEVYNVTGNWIGNMDTENEKVNEQEWKNIMVLELKAALTNS